MSLQPNSKFGNYEIGDSIGVGGMGEVFRATDTTLEREVAIKVLPDTFAADTDRVSRFEREAKTLASLNHPNIAQIHGLEKAGDITAIVMELVEGPTLADRLKDGAIPVEETMRIAKQIMDGLQAAHEQGVVHRDLKPANIKVKADGSVKILDFGIAKPMDIMGSSGGQTPTQVTPAVTETGVIMGTAGYMSPEQAQGKFVDQRTDIWAFGCVLFEMLTGQPAFAGENVMLTLAKVLANETELDSIPASISPAVRHTLKLCLEKDPKKRVHHIGDVRMAMEGVFNIFEETEVASMSHGFFWSRAIPITLMVAALVGSWIYYQMKPEPQEVNRFSYALPADQQYRGTGRGLFALSPDGRYFVYNTPQGLYLRDMSELEARLIPGTEEVLFNPFFSPDSQSIAYLTLDGELKRIAVSGGAPVVITQSGNIGGAHWTQDDTIYFSGNGSIYQVSANGGTPELIIDASEIGAAVGSPNLLPDSDSLLFTTIPAGEIMAFSMSSREITGVLSGGRDARYLPSGHLIYGIWPGNGLFAQPFDLDTLTVSGGPVPLVQNVLVAQNSSPINYGVSDNGTLVYVHSESQGLETGTNTLSWVTQDGEESPIDLPPRNYIHARVSPDGSRMGFEIDGDLWVSDINRPVLSRITETDFTEFAPIWTRDSQSLVFSVMAEATIYSTLADGTGEIEELIELPEPGLLAAGDWVPEEEGLLFTYGTSGSEDPSIQILSLDPPNNDVPAYGPFIDRESGASVLNVSPAGDWVSYHADDTGQYDVYIERFPELGTRTLISDSDGGWGAYWSADGSELYYRRLGDGAMMAVSIQYSPSLLIGTPRVLFENNNYYPITTPQAGGGSARPWGLAPDGRFLMIKQGGARGNIENRIVIVQNWLEELQRLVPTE